MRIAPLAFLLDPVNPDHRVVIRDVSRITHHSEEAYVESLAVLLANYSVLLGAWSPQRTFLALTLDNLPDSAVRDRIEQLAHAQLPAAEVAARFGASGHVVDTVPLALYCAQSIASNDLSDVLAMTIGAGGDTDTIASTAGQLAGTVVGVAGVPSHLLPTIQGVDNVVATPTNSPTSSATISVGPESDQTSSPDPSPPTPSTPAQPFRLPHDPPNLGHSGRRIGIPYPHITRKFVKFSKIPGSRFASA